jgi:ribosome-associated protein
MKTFYITSPYIELVRLLKANIRYVSDGDVRQLISDGFVKVDGHVETRRKCKILPGQVVVTSEITITVKEGR